MINCSSEIGKLLKLIVHRPDKGIERISPRHAETLLFDDIVFYPLMLEEYDVYIKTLQLCLGEENVLFIEKLLEQSLIENSELKDELLDKIIIEEELAPHKKVYLNNLPAAKLANILITGFDEVEDEILFDPIPNFMFTRDIGVTVNSGVIITKAAKMARWRENLLTRMIIAKHELFADARDSDLVINLNRPENFPPSKYGEKVSIEGGDVMVIDKDYILIGVSERSTAHGFDLLKKTLFEKNLVKNVVKINIPKDRSYMHIDTIFTQVDESCIVCFKPIVYDGLGSNVEVHKADGSMLIYSSIKDFYLQEINPNMKFIFAGKGFSPYQEREQWTDGCNLLALKPGVAISYDRNIQTAKAFEKEGYTVIKAQDFIEKYKDVKDPLSHLDKTILSLPSSELSRARGGSHCMSFPVLREEM
jgi:arginine deiminase